MKGEGADGERDGGASIMKVESQTKQTQESVLSRLNIRPALSQGQRQMCARRVMYAVACATSSLLQYLKKLLTPHLDNLQKCYSCATHLDFQI